MAKRLVPGRLKQLSAAGGPCAKCQNGADQRGPCASMPKQSRLARILQKNAKTESMITAPTGGDSVAHLSASPAGNLWGILVHASPPCNLGPRLCLGHSAILEFVGGSLWEFPTGAPGGKGWPNAYSVLPERHGSVDPGHPCESVGGVAGGAGREGEGASWGLGASAARAGGGGHR